MMGSGISGFSLWEKLAPKVTEEDKESSPLPSQLFRTCIFPIFQVGLH